MADESSSVLVDTAPEVVEDHELKHVEAEKEEKSEPENGSSIPTLSFNDALSASGSLKASSEMQMVEVHEEPEVQFESSQSAPSSWKAGLTPRKASRPDPVVSTYESQSMDASSK